MNEDSDWFVSQAAASAKRLAQTPANLLGPIGRDLRDLAAHWPEPLKTTAALAIAPSQDRPQKATETSVQLPLLGPVD